MTPAADSIPTTPFNENAQPSIMLPPPTRGGDHLRSRASIQLPPLSTRTTSVSPTRYSSLLPPLRSSRNSSPERSTTTATTEGAEVGDGVDARARISKHRSTASVSKLASWFEGTSDPVRVGLVPSPRRELPESVTGKEQASTMFSSNSEEADNLITRKSLERQKNTNSAGISRFNFFRRPTQTQVCLAVEDNDELSQLDLREALFPAGEPEEVSPGAFKDLQSHAEGTLRRFQNTHIEQQKVLKSLISAKEAQADHLEAAETRNQHLKLQLSEMAERAAEQERQINALKAELDIVRQQPHALDAALAQGGIRKVPQNSAERYRNKRHSEISASEESESGSDIISIFSDPMSADESPGTSVCESPVIKHAIMYQPRMEQPKQVLLVPECQKCHGLGQNEAWDVVSMMKAESQGLKHRIAELEGAHEDALAFLKSMNIV